MSWTFRVGIIGEETETQRRGLPRLIQLRLESTYALASQFAWAGVLSLVIYKMCQYQNIKNPGKERYKKTEYWWIDFFFNSETTKGVNERNSIFQP